MIMSIEHWVGPENVTIAVPAPLVGSSSILHACGLLGIKKKKLQERKVYNTAKQRLSLYLVTQLKLLNKCSNLLQFQKATTTWELWGTLEKISQKFYDIYAKQEELSKIFPMKIHKSLTLTHSGIVNYKHIERHIIIRKSRDIYQRASERERDWVLIRQVKYVDVP